MLIQKAYTEDELNAKLTRRVQKAARRQAKQEELKRLHRAQVMSGGKNLLFPLHSWKEEAIYAHIYVVCTAKVHMALIDITWPK